MNLIDVHTHFFPDDMKSNRIKYYKIDSNFNQLYANDDAQICIEDDLKMILSNNPKLKIVILSIGYTDYELTKYTNDFLIELSQKYSQVKTLGSINPAWTAIGKLKFPTSISPASPLARAFRAQLNFGLLMPRLWKRLHVP